MKKTNVKRVISFIMSIILVIVFAVSVGASAPNESYDGTIIIDGSSPAVDLSNIEIKVFSAQPIYDSETQKLLYYGETYAFSVYTDENGEFSFIKPTEFCSVTINLESLPDGYGIGQKVQFIIPRVTHHTYVLSKVEKTDVRMEQKQITASFYDNNGKRLNVEYQVEETPLTMETWSATQIMQMTSYDITGKVITPNEEIPFSFPIDLSEYSLQTKIEYFYAEGMISEEKKIDVYCDILLDESSNTQLKSDSTLVKEIFAYKNQVLQKNQEVSQFASTSEIVSVEDSLMEKINTISQQVDRSSIIYQAKIQRVLDDGFIFAVFYDSRDVNAIIEVDEIANYFTEAYDFFVIELGFNAPIPDTQGYYQITHKNDSSDEKSGLTEYSWIPGSTHITINYAERGTDSELKHTIAHELHHAIMATYGFNPSSCQEWVREGFANVAGMVFANSATRGAVEHILAYLQKSYLSIYDGEVDAYGTMLYPLYIYENLGGWNTIKQIYNNFSATGNIYTSITNSGSISSYNAAFAGMFSNNYKPSAFYFSLDEYTTLDNVVPKISYDIGSSYLLSTELMAGRYRQVISATPVGTLYITCSIEDGSGSGFYINKITESGNNISSVETVASNFTQVTFVQRNFGSEVTKLTLVATNTNNAGVAILCGISLSI